MKLIIKEKEMIQSRSNMMRSISIAVTIVFLLVSILASTESVDAASKLKVTVTKKTIYVGQTAKFKANKNVKWTVSRKKIVKLTKIRKRTVTVKGLKAGTVYVKARAGKKTKRIKIVVKPKVKMRLESSSDFIGVGEFCALRVKYGKSSGAVNEATFTSSDTSVAIVNRRGLVTGISPGTATITAKSKKYKNLKATTSITVVATKAGTLTLKVDLSDESRYPEGKAAKVWLPVPQSDDYQNITQVDYTVTGEKAARLTTDSAGGKQLYIEWGADASPKDRVATLSYHIYRKAVVRDENIASMEHGTVAEAAAADEVVAEALKPTMWSGDLESGIVKETADRIVKAAGAKTVYEKAFAINDWMCDNMTRIDDKKVLFGDVVSILEGKRYAGSCMDMNSVFVALCRAEGIPARNLFGLRFAPKAPGKIGPNCRAEFYLPGYGWVPADPALAIKQSWGYESEYIGENAPLADIWEGIKDMYWGNGEENWICVNMGRDITLDPPQSIDPGDEYLEVLNPGGTINLYMFPYGEFGDQYIPCQDSKNFKYEYSFEEEDPLDCGC